MFGFLNNSFGIVVNRKWWTQKELWLARFFFKLSSFAFQDDEFTHVYTLIVRPDNTYEVKIDNERVEGGDLEADWDFLPAKMIDDPNEKKPSDWDDRKKIDDESDVKPEVCAVF